MSYRYKIQTPNKTHNFEVEYELEDEEINIYLANNNDENPQYKIIDCEIIGD